METMRSVLRESLARSLSYLRDEDKLAAAWTVACGRAMAGRGSVVGYENRLVRVEVADPVWMQQMSSMRSLLARDMAKIAGLPIAGIHFELKKK